MYRSNVPTHIGAPVESSFAAFHLANKQCSVPMRLQVGIEVRVAIEFLTASLYVAFVFSLSWFWTVVSNEYSRHGPSGDTYSAR